MCLLDVAGGQMLHIRVMHALAEEILTVIAVCCTLRYCRLSVAHKDIAENGGLRNNYQVS